MSTESIVLQRIQEFTYRQGFSIHTGCLQGGEPNLKSDEVYRALEKLHAETRVVWDQEGEHVVLIGEVPEGTFKRSPGSHALFPPVGRIRYTPSHQWPARPETPGKTTSSPRTKSYHDPDSTIRILVNENPKRKGSSSYDRFELYYTHTTVKDFLANGGTKADLDWDLNKEFIKLEQSDD